MFNRVLFFLFFILFPLKANNTDLVKNEFTIIQINAKWNTRNDIKIFNIPNCNIKYAFLEDQTESMKSTIQYVPTVVLYKKNKSVYQWAADLSFKLELTNDEIESVIKKINND